MSLIKRLERTKAVWEQIQSEIKAIEADERYHYPTATVFENAPLALEQQAMTVRIGTLRFCQKLVGDLLTAWWDE